jgi:hypothetical protein
LTQNSEFQNENQKLQNQGFTPKDAQYNPSANNSGDFRIEYQNQAGEKHLLVEVLRIVN